MKLACQAIPLLACGNAGESSPSRTRRTPADFYRGRTVNLIAGFNPGGGADTYARLVARHLGKHIAGQSRP